MKTNLLAIKLTTLILLLPFYQYAQNCTPTFFADLSLVTASPSQQNEISQVHSNAKNILLASVAPSSSTVTAAINAYNNLNIRVTGSTITGNTITSFNDVSFISTFADHLKFNPSDAAMIERAQNTIWWTYVNVCNNNISSDYAGYVFRNFARKGVFCLENSNYDSKQRFLYIVEKNSENWNVFWKSSYNYTTQLTTGVINTDYIYNSLDMMVPLLKAFNTADEQFRYLKTLERYITRFVSVFTNGTTDGLKPDGCGFHHNNNYEAYMYAYNTVITTMQMLGNTGFQIKSPAYLSFRDAVMHKYLIANNLGYYPLSLSGRSGNWEINTLTAPHLKNLALIGGQILGLTTADTVLAGLYNQLNGIDPAFNYNQSTPFITGFYQMNHTNAGVFRSNNCIIINKGFNDQFWGAEGYSTENRYGRYQSYGALTIMYSGNRAANGFSNTAWDWNYNPGATTKVLSWNNLLAGWNRIDEYSSKKIAGSLQFSLKNAGYLNNVMGTYGMFAMDFQERQNLGFSGVTNTDTHDPSFTFKKSNFFFNDVIICLASGISNIDASNPTVTTLYQNVTTPNNVTVNNSTFSTAGSPTTFSGTANNWVLDNFGNGYYILSGSGNLVLQRKDQQTPSPTQTNPSILNPATQAAIGYINHGTSPSNAGYEYVIKPNASISDMQALAVKFQSASTKPYEIINKTSGSHIIKHRSTSIFGMALFSANTTIPGVTNIASNNLPCLIMYQPNAGNTEMKLSLTDPDLGLTGTRSTGSFPKKTIRITLNGSWKITNPNPGIAIVSNSKKSTVLDFTVYQGLPIEANFIRQQIANAPYAFLSIVEKKYSFSEFK